MAVTVLNETDSEALVEALNRCRTLPSPPGIAIQVVQLAQDPEAGLAEVADLICKDPALATRILRAANSPLYARNREITNLRQALMVLGLHATLSLALGFSLVAGIKKGEQDSLDYPLFWRRAVLAAMVSRALAEHLELDHSDDVFLIGLLQDIGMLALDRAFADYGELFGEATDHDDLAERERARFGSDHAAVGHWLLAKWGLPDFLCRAVGASHDPEGTRDMVPAQRDAVRCVSVSSSIADIFLSQGDREERIRKAARLAQTRLGVEAEAFTSLIESICEHWPETTRVYDLSVEHDFDPDAIMEEARDVLLVRNLHAIQQANEYRDRAESLEERNRTLEMKNRLDGLTNLYNRAYFEERIAEEFGLSDSHGWPLSLAFLDLDHFKRINDTYGHQVGDEVLRSVADVIMNTVRNTDIPCRYGGEEFVVVIPGYGADQAIHACERVRRRVAETPHALVNGEPVHCTLSVGLATHNGPRRFEGHADLVRAADRAVYAAKLGGRNRTVLYDTDSGD